MSNKFTKSVLERQAKEARQNRAITDQQEIYSEELLDAEMSTPEIDIITKESSAPLVQQSTAAPITTSRSKKVTGTIPAAMNLDAFMIHDEGRNAKNKTFYLDSAVIDAIHRAATERKVTDSKLVNDIMKKILGI